MHRLLKGVLGAVLTASPLVGLVHCSTVPADPDDAGGACAPREVSEQSGDDSGVQCEHFFFHACGIPSGVISRDNCYFALEDCSSLCGGPYFTCVAYGPNCVDGSIVVPSDAGLVVECGSCPTGTGRRPAGLAARTRRKQKSALTTRDRVGEYFENAAYLEAASVHAFRIMKRELASHRAPKELILAAKRAEDDEVKHTRMTARLARAHGGTPERARVQKLEPRTLEAIALENATEGCIRETFGALVAMWQAKTARDRDVALAMREIAVDETRHAALSWSVAAWAEPQLDAKARARIDEARANAVSALRAEISREPHRVLIEEVGLPAARAQRELLAALLQSIG